MYPFKKRRVVTGVSGLRVGIGIDVHRFAPDTTPRDFWLAGLLWENAGNGLEGHSDADVAVHAIIDSLLSAANMGDIGSVFGVDEEKTAGASGRGMLETVVKKLRVKKYAVINVSVQLVANRPKFTDRAAEANVLLSKIIGSPVSIAATTSDGLGLTGRGEGIAAVSNALLYHR